MASDVNVTGVVLIVGLVVLVVILVGFIVIYGQHSTALDQAGQNLENAITVLVAAFERFGTTIASSLTRLTVHLRDLFESFLGNITAAFADSLTFFSNAFNRVFSTLDHVGTQIGSQFEMFYYKGIQILSSLSDQVAAKMLTIPTNVGLYLILAFVSLVTEGIQIITCFAINAVGEIESAFNTGVDAIENTFTTGLANEATTILNAILPTINTISTTLTNIGNYIQQLPGQIENALRSIVAPLIDAVDSISGAFSFLGSIGSFF